MSILGRECESRNDDNHSKRSEMLQFFMFELKESCESQFSWQEQAIVDLKVDQRDFAA